MTLQPLQRDGVREFGIGSVIFAVASAILYFGRAGLGVPDWWLQVALSGLVIGLIATGYCLWTRGDRAKKAQSNSDLS